MTKVVPTIPIKNRRIAKPAYELTSPVMPTGMEARIKIVAIGSLAPYWSQIGPMNHRKKRVLTSEHMVVTQMFLLDKPRSF
jgi:hypothetical protein